jgi:hypothetical protein
VGLMSVDNQAVELGTDAIQKEGDQKATTVHTVHEDSLQSTVSDLMTESIPAGDVGAGEKAKDSSEGTVVSPAREWFDNIDTFERVAALGFVDGPFLATLLSFASWSTQSSRRSGLEGEGEYLFHVRLRGSVPSYCPHAEYNLNLESSEIPVGGQTDPDFRLDLLVTTLTTLLEQTMSWHHCTGTSIFSLSLLSTIRREIHGLQ